MTKPRTITPRQWLAVLLCSSMLAGGVVAPSGAADKASDNKDDSTKEVSIPAPVNAGEYLAGRFAQHEQDINRAANYVDSALKQAGNDSTLLFEALRLQVAAGNIEQAVEVAETMRAKGIEDPLISLVLIAHSAKVGAFSDATTEMEQSLDHGLYAVIKPVLSQWLVVGKGEMNKPVNMEETIARADFLAPFIYYQVALMNDVLGYHEAAYDAYIKASQDPSTTPYRVVQALANYHLRQGNPQGAEPVYADYEEQNGDSKLIPEEIPHIHTPPKDVPPLVGDAAEGLSEVLFTTASVLFGEEVARDTMVYLQLAIYLRDELAPAHFMLANLYEQAGQHEQAIIEYDRIPKNSIFYRRGQIRIALNLEAMGEVSAALQKLNDMSDAGIDARESLATKGDIYRAEKLYKQAIRAYSEALRSNEAPDGDIWTIYYARGIAYERSGRWQQAEADFLKALELKPDQPDVMNYLGYSWLVQGVKIEEAQSYIARAVSVRPHDAHIVDSMGWALYLSGEFENATRFLEKAVELAPQDPTVNEHLGDAYWRSGRKAEARFQWDRALTFQPDEETEREIRRKLKSGMQPFEPLVTKGEKKDKPLASRQHQPMRAN